ncbi:Exportin-5 [Orchesella cincta]|uniref:Exportin-5 n=1 Tax=Orchesella cincta TaxID=48709 RepID=A0A1D2N4F8_ORCCI|nr:Exportin-5 [Orchesella cincta]
MNLSEDAILQKANGVALSVKVAIDPNSEHLARQQAHQFYEEFRKNGSPVELCAVGFALSVGTEGSVILAGLKLIEHVAKYHWNTLADRDTVKDRLLLLMHNGLSSGAAGWPIYLQEALSKVIVEIAKREWPQLWPNLFPKLFEIAHASDLALLVLRRMAEDVVTLQLVDCSERKKELSLSLNAIAPDVITTLFKVLVSSVQAFNASHSDALRRRGKVCLGCLLPYIEWLNPNLFAQDNRISILFALLPEKEFQIEAADCIIQLLERKPVKKEDKYDVPKICLDQECSLVLIRSIDESSNDLDYLRKAGNIVTLLAPNVCEGKVNVENFFNCTLKLASKPQAVAVRLLNAICNKFVSAPPTPEEKEELAKLKAEFSQMLRNVGKRLPKLYKEVNTWLHSSLNSPNAVQVYQWETLVLVIDSVASSISHEDKEMVEIGLRDLEQCYSKFKEETSLELKSIILSTVSALFVFLGLAKDSQTFGDVHMTFMNSILGSVFECFNYENVVYARDIRRHAAALMIKLSTKHPDLLVLSFDFIHSAATTIAPKLSTMEYTTVMESLNDSSKQSQFVASLLVAAEWNEISNTCQSLQTFVNILQEAVFQDKRIIFLKNLTMLHSVIRRVKRTIKPNSILQQSRTGENLNAAAAHNEIENQHPAYDPVCPLLPVILKLAKTIHSLLDDPQLAFLMELSDQEKSHIMGIHFNGGAHTVAGESIPSSVLGVDNEKSHPEKLKIFITSLVDLTYGILGGTPALFAPKFYYIPQVTEAYLSFVGWNNSKMDDFRLRGVIRAVFSPFLLNCPAAQYEIVVKPFLQSFGPFVLDRLVARWTAIENSEISGGDGEEEKEVLENTSLRLLTKDYIDLIHKLLELKASSNVSATTNSEVDTEMGSEMEAATSTITSQLPSSFDPGDCGILLLSDPTCFNAILYLCIHALCWDDSSVCLKAARCILLSWRKLSEQTEVIRATFSTVLRALCIWYENEADMDSLFKVLDTIFKTCYENDPTISQMLLDWGANTQDIQRLVALCHGPKNDKKRKDMYRRMVLNNPAIEKNKSPKAQWLRGLPQLNFNKSKDAKQKSPDIDLSECFSVIHST